MTHVITACQGSIELHVVYSEAKKLKHRMIH